MRTIKFRAWDGSKMMYRGLFDKNWYATEKNDEGGCHCIREIHQSDKQLVIEQFTGLTDKNGKEVYEGDIIQFDFGKESKEGIINTLVVFYDGCFMYESHSSKQILRGLKWSQEHDYCKSYWFGPGCKPLCSGYYGKGDLGLLRNPKSKISVVGNIHETPNLLK